MPGSKLLREVELVIMREEFVMRLWSSGIQPSVIDVVCGIIR